MLGYTAARLSLLLPYCGAPFFLHDDPYFYFILIFILSRRASRTDSESSSIGVSVLGCRGLHILSAFLQRKDVTV